MLGAFVRTRAPNTPECSTLPPPHPNPDDLPRLAPDIQSAITVIGRRDTPSVGHVDLSRTCLKGADLRFADLRNVDLEFSSLVWADMRHANLQGATVHLANFHSAYMNGVNLEEARFEVVNFTAALMEDGNIRSAKMINCPLINAVFLGADLKGLEISFSDLSGADFAPEVNLEHSTAAKNLGQAKLEHVHYNNDTTWPKGFTPPENADPGL
ncbi:pentapeptide repeat-containing protein [Nocardia arthritidis]|uniref:pentapeptide repeat-containing protein n=1 Tax=Nocardia arthritidis TaxID=228602 RepID=UPI0023B0D36A|nr:pentapeptide repeat-containing protein [Nocardia arthritidis]